VRRMAAVLALVLASLLAVPVLPADAGPADSTAIYVTVVEALSPPVAGRPTDFMATLASGDTVLPGKELTLWLKPYGSTTFSQAGQATTDASGSVAVWATLQRNAVVEWRFAGADTYAASTSTPYVVQISPRVTIRVNDRTLRRGQRFVVRGRSFPAKPGCVAKLWRGELRPLVEGPAPVRLATATVRADGSYRLVHRFKKKRRMRVAVTISACSGNARGLSSYVGIRVR
jgi:hypothetical protein